jgi:heme exporter protein B
LEWRERNGLFNTLLYALATSYIASLVFEIGPGVKVWSGLIWFLMLFNSITASSASFRHEAGSRFMYYHQLVEPQQLFLAKWIYNILYGLILILIQYGLLQFFIGAPTEQGVAYLLQLVAGATGLMGVLTLTSAIASLSGNNVSLMAVLSFPLLIPVLLIGLRGTVKAGIDASWSELWPYIGANLGMSALVAALGYLLFPYLWRD